MSQNLHGATEAAGLLCSLGIICHGRELGPEFQYVV